MTQVLNKKEFCQYIFKNYQPSAYEQLVYKGTQFPNGICYPHIYWTRYFYIYREIATRLFKGAEETLKVLDLGCFPGTLIRVLKSLLGGRIFCYGAGLMIDKDFEAHMAPYSECCIYTEFDPFYAKSEEPIHLAFENETFDVIIATEVLEHLISPLELVAEGLRVLRKGGLFIVTTPNVSHIGAVIKLMLGKSIYEPLDDSVMYGQHEEWRRHIRFYDKRELETLFLRNQLKMVRHRYYTELGWWNHVRLTCPQKLLFIVRKLFWCIPIYREKHLAVFSKV